MDYAAWVMQCPEIIPPPETCQLVQYPITASLLLSHPNIVHIDLLKLPYTRTLQYLNPGTNGWHLAALADLSCQMPTPDRQHWFPKQKRTRSADGKVG
jgi:hypothetical protein